MDLNDRPDFPPDFKMQYRERIAAQMPVPDANLRWNAARIPVQRRGRTVNDLALPEATLRAASEFVDSFAERYVPETTALEQFPEDRSLIGVGLTLTGMPKVGKTSLGCAILTEVAVTCLVRPLSVLYTPWPDYMHFFNERHAWREAKNGIEHEDDLESLDAAMHRVEHDSLILLDDVGIERVTSSGAARDELSRIVRARYRRGLVTLVASSLAPASMHELYGAHLSDFLLGTFEHLHIQVR